MSINVSEFVWQRLSEWGLKRVYGYPGDGVGGLDVALEKAKDFMEYVQVRHEEMAAFMASAHAKFTGQSGFATRRPVRALFICSTAFTTPSWTMCRSWRWSASRRARRSAPPTSRRSTCRTCSRTLPASSSALASVPEQVRHLIDRAVRIAQTKRAVTCVILPNDLQLLPYEDPPMAHGATHTGIGYAGAGEAAGPGAASGRRPKCSTAARRSPCWSGPARSTRPTR